MWSGIPLPSAILEKPGDVWRRNVLPNMVHDEEGQTRGGGGEGTRQVCRSKNAPPVAGRGMKKLVTVTTSRAEGAGSVRQAGWWMDIRSWDGRAARGSGESLSFPSTGRISLMTCKQLSYCNDMEYIPA